MTTYIYFVKCPGCEDEHFDFFDEAKEFALGCLSQKPIITQTEVCRNDFGECTDSADLGTVWSWEDMMKDTTTDADPAVSVFTKDDLECMNRTGKPCCDTEFDNLDNSVDFEPEIQEVSDNFRKPIPEGMTLESLVETLEEFEDEVECKNCFDLFPKVDCTKHDHGYICPVCGNAAAQSTGSVDETLADLVIDEFEAIDGYEVADEVVQHANIPAEKKAEILGTLDHIKKEEEEHIDELKELSGNSEYPTASEEPITLHEDEDEIDEDTVECTWCNDLFDKSECRYEVDLGWLCSRCEMAIKSRGETLTFREGNYWDFLDEEVDELTEASLSDIAAAANSEFGTSWDEDYLLDTAGVDDEFSTKTKSKPVSPKAKSRWVLIKPNPPIEVPAELVDCVLTSDESWAYRILQARHGSWYNKGWRLLPFEDACKKLTPEDCERARHMDEALTEDSVLEELEPTAEVHDLGNEYDGGYPVEKPNLPETDEITDSHLALCPECGKEAFDTETGICVNCGFN